MAHEQIQTLPFLVPLNNVTISVPLNGLSWPPITLQVRQDPSEKAHQKIDFSQSMTIHHEY
jgi:hypothetical protein